MCKNKYFSFLSALAGVAMLCMGCDNSSQGCSIKGQTDFKEYTMAYLLDLDRNKLDSVSLEEGKFGFVVADSVSKPYAIVVQLVNPNDRLDRMDMPVMVEPGVVSLQLGEYIYTSGTPLNLKVQEFLNALQQFKDGIHLSASKDITQLQTAYSEFYRQQILSNRDNVLGVYILHDYGVHLTPADRELVETQLNY